MLLRSAVLTDDRVNLMLSGFGDITVCMLQKVCRLAIRSRSAFELLTDGLNNLRVREGWEAVLGGG